MNTNWTIKLLSYEFYGALCYGGWNCQTLVMGEIASPSVIMVLVTERSLLASNMLSGSVSPTFTPLDIVSFFASS